MLPTSSRSGGLRELILSAPEASMTVVSRLLRSCEMPAAERLIAAALLAEAPRPRLREKESEYRIIWV